MQNIASKEIVSSRLLQAPIALVYRAFADPAHLQHWWGPKGFTNTIHEFDLQPGGQWRLTMHGPEKGNYQNLSVFTIVQPEKRICWTRQSQPFFDMEVSFERLDDHNTLIAFRMTFNTAGACEKIRKFVEPNNEENFDRLEKEISNMMLA